MEHGPYSSTVVMNPSRSNNTMGGTSNTQNSMLLPVFRQIATSEIINVSLHLLTSISTIGKIYQPLQIVTKNRPDSPVPGAQGLP